MTDQLAGVDDRPAQHAAGSADASTHRDVGAGGDAGGDESHRRVSRWDRPPEPRDWRFFVGTLGKILIATGLLMLGFVAYQLWGTGIETARAQDRLESQFEELLAEYAGAEEAAPAGAEGRPEAAENPDVGDAPTTGAPGGSAAPEPLDEEAITPPASGAAVPVAVDLSDQAVVQDPIPQPFRGDPLFRLEIPKIGRDDIVVPGVQLNDLKKGPGHYPDTPLPGQLGNAAIAGHRTTYGAPFFDVDQLTAGDEIVTTLLNGDRFVYEVTFVEVVAATDYWVVATADPNIAELTLTSCHPKYTARDRIVVHSVLNPAKSSNVGVPTFYSLEPDPDDAPIPGDDPVLTATLSEGSTVASGTQAAPAPTDAAAPEPAEPDEGASAPAEPSAQAAEPDVASTALADPDPIDAFEQGWFDDTGAFPQIALWAAVLALVCIAGYQVAKRFRRWSVGIVVGVVPFLVTLYFVYQNVNRLLPPGI